MPVVLLLWASLLQVVKVDANKIIPGILISLAGILVWQKFRSRMNQRLSKNFTLQEFASKDGAQTPESVLDNLRELAKNLQVLRDIIGKPIKINSGYRSPEHNKSVGGVKNSMHVQGKAADIVIEGLTPRQVAEQLEILIASKRIKQGGLGIYPTFVHYDIRGKKARW